MATATTSKKTTENKAKAIGNGFQSFFTKDAANDGVKVPLRYPDGSKSPYWLIVAGEYSDIYIKGITSLQRRNLKRRADFSTDDEAQDWYAEEFLKIKASCILEWNFNEDEADPWELTPANALKLLHEGPQVAATIESVIYNRSNFIKKK